MAIYGRVLLLGVVCLYGNISIAQAIGADEEREKVKERPTTPALQESRSMDQSRRENENIYSQIEKPSVCFIEPYHGFSSDMNLIMGESSDATWIGRLEALDELGSNLDAAQINALYALMSRDPKHDATGIEEFTVIKNQAAIVLLRQRTAPVHFANNLVAMFFSSVSDVVWRDYCVQFMGQSFGGFDRAEQALVAQVLWAAVEETATTIGGTSLIALQQNAANAAVGVRPVMDKALNLVRANDTTHDMRVTALQVSAELGDGRALESARALASAEDIPMRLRMSAIAAIGALGDAGDVSFLQAQSTSDEPFIRKSASLALKRLNDRS